MEGPGAESEEMREPAGDIETAAVDSGHAAVPHALGDLPKNHAGFVAKATRPLPSSCFCAMSFSSEGTFRVRSTKLVHRL
jgi:hypothetical protein